jgi:hypothetical protein
MNWMGLLCAFPESQLTQDENEQLRTLMIKIYSRELIVRIDQVYLAMQGNQLILKTVLEYHKDMTQADFVKYCDRAIARGNISNNLKA